MGLQNPIVDLAGLIGPVFHDQELNVVLVNLQFFGMVAVKGPVLGNRLIKVADGEIEIPQHHICGGVVWQIMLHLCQESLGISPFALCQVQPGQRFSRLSIVRISRD